MYKKSGIKLVLIPVFVLLFVILVLWLFFDWDRQKLEKSDSLNISNIAWPAKIILTNNKSASVYRKPRMSNKDLPEISEGSAVIEFHGKNNDTVWVKKELSNDSDISLSNDSGFLSDSGNIYYKPVEKKKKKKK